MNGGFVSQKLGSLACMNHLRFLFGNGQFQYRGQKGLDLAHDDFRFGFGADDAHHKVVSIATILEAFEMRVKWVACWQGLPHSFEVGNGLSSSPTIDGSGIPLFSNLAYPMAVVAIARVWSSFL